jgi:hypothetical protein
VTSLQFLHVAAFGFTEANHEASLVQKDIEVCSQLANPRIYAVFLQDLIQFGGNQKHTDPWARRGRYAVKPPLADARQDFIVY